MILSHFFLSVSLHQHEVGERDNNEKCCTSSMEGKPILLLLLLFWQTEITIPRFLLFVERTQCAGIVENKTR